MKILIVFGLLIIAVSNCSNAPSSNDTAAAPPLVVNYDSLRTELETMYDTDQGLRAQVSQMTAYDAELVVQMNRADSLNQSQVQLILDSYGWLTTELIGEKAADALWFVVQHGKLTMIEKYYPDFQTLADRGLANIRKAGMMQDRMLMYQNKPQVYGTQVSGKMLEDGSWDSMVWPIEAPGSVNERRQAIGITQSIEDYAAEMQARFDPNEPLVPQER
jgi:hypothetical protein